MSVCLMSSLVLLCCGDWSVYVHQLWWLVRVCLPTEVIGQCMSTFVMFCFASQSCLRKQIRNKPSTALIWRQSEWDWINSLLKVVSKHSNDVWYSGTRVCYCLPHVCDERGTMTPQGRYRFSGKALHTWASILTVLCYFMGLFLSCLVMSSTTSTLSLSLSLSESLPLSNTSFFCH